MYNSLAWVDGNCRDTCKGVWVNSDCLGEVVGLYVFKDCVGSEWDSALDAKLISSFFNVAHLIESKEPESRCLVVLVVGNAEIIRASRY